MCSCWRVRHRVTPTPEFEEGSGGHVLFIVDVAKQAKGVTVHPVPVKIEELGERLATAGQGCRAS